MYSKIADCGLYNPGPFLISFHTDGVPHPQWISQPFQELLEYFLEQNKVKLKQSWGVGKSLRSSFHSLIYSVNRYYVKHWVTCWGNSRWNELGPYSQSAWYLSCGRKWPKELFEHEEESHPNLNAKSGKSSKIYSQMLNSVPSAPCSQSHTAQTYSTLTWVPSHCPSW